MTNLGEQFSDSEVDEILREIDTTGNGIIRYEGEKISIYKNKQFSIILFFYFL